MENKMNHEKGATQTDRALHRMMDFYKNLRPEEYKSAEWEGMYAFYHEEGLYSVYETRTGICTLIYAKTPYEAMERVKKVYNKDENRTN